MSRGKSVQMRECIDSVSVLTDETRLHIILLLLEYKKGYYVGELADVLGLEQSTISHAVRFLARERVVRSEREGRHIRYTMAASVKATHIAKVCKVYGLY
jgi:DNA-binding transcriptional ArsR family regulator